MCIVGMIAQRILELHEAKIEGLFSDAAVSPSIPTEYSAKKGRFTFLILLGLASVKFGIVKSFLIQFIDQVAKFAHSLSVFVCNLNFFFFWILLYLILLQKFAGFTISKVKLFGLSTF